MKYYYNFYTDEHNFDSVSLPKKASRSCWCFFPAGYSNFIVS